MTDVRFQPGNVQIAVLLGFVLWCVIVDGLLVLFGDNKRVYRALWSAVFVGIGVLFVVAGGADEAGWGALVGVQFIWLVFPAVVSAIKRVIS